MSWLLPRQRELPAQSVRPQSCAKRFRMLAVVLFPLIVTACANTVDPPPNAPDQPVPVACGPYPASVNPQAPKVYLVPQLNDPGNRGRCSIDSMALAVHNKGEFRNIYGPVAGQPPVSPSAVIDPVIASLTQQAGRLTCPSNEPMCHPVFKILIFAHGGLVSHSEAVMSAEALAPGMLADGYAPVFLIWNSDFTTAYEDRLCCVLEGEENQRYAAYFAPVRLVGDIAASAARAMENFGQQLIRFQQSVIETRGTEYYLEPSDADPASGDSICASLNRDHCPTIVYPSFHDSNFGPPEVFAHLNGEDQRTVEKTAGYAATAPLRVVSTVILPQGGAESWDNMVRRTRLALQQPILTIANVQARLLARSCADKTRSAHTPSSQDTATPTGGPSADRFRPEGEGAFVIFFDRLECEINAQNFVAANGQPVKVELHFFGHSMGALVGNEVLVRYPSLPWRRIVYMAAATPVRDFKLMVAPLLNCTPDNKSQLCAKDPRDPNYPGVHFYNLMLHPLAESHDLEAFGVVPEGSLLEWNDEMFGGPKSVDDRMLGKWTNAEKTMSWFAPDMRDRMLFRVFPAQARMSNGDSSERVAFQAECVMGPIAQPKPGDLPPRCHPIMHGQFAAYSFWRDDFLCGPNPCPDAEPPPPALPMVTGELRAALLQRPR